MPEHFPDTAIRPIARKAPGRRGGPSRPRSPVLRMSGLRATAAAPTRRGMPGRFLRSLQTSRPPCRSMIPAREPGGCWRLTLISPALAVMFMVLLSVTTMNITLSLRTRSAFRPRPSLSSWPAAAARSSLTSLRPAAATSSSCSPRRCRGSSCVTSPAPWRCASPRSTRRRCRLSAARSLLLAAGGAGVGPTSEPDRTLRRVRTGQRGCPAAGGWVVSVRSGSGGARL